MLAADVETVTAIAYLDADGELAVAVHRAFAFDEQLPGSILAFGFGAPQGPIPSAVNEAGFGFVHLVPEAGTAMVLDAAAMPISFNGFTSAAFGTAIGFAKADLGVTALQLEVDGLATPINFNTPDLVAGDRAIAVAHLEANLDPAIAFIAPDVSAIADGNVRVHVLHANPAVSTINVGFASDAPFITDLAFGSLSAGSEVPVDDYRVSVDVDDDGIYDISISASLATLGVEPGMVVVLVAYMDADSKLAVGALALIEDTDVGNYPGALNFLGFVTDLTIGEWVDITFFLVSTGGGAAFEAVETPFPSATRWISYDVQVPPAVSPLSYREITVEGATTLRVVFDASIESSGTCQWDYLVVRDLAPATPVEITGSATAGASRICGTKTAVAVNIPSNKFSVAVFSDVSVSAETSAALNGWRIVSIQIDP